MLIIWSERSIQCSFFCFLLLNVLSSVFYSLTDRCCWSIISYRLTNNALIWCDPYLIRHNFMLYWFKHLIKTSGCWTFVLTLMLCMLWVSLLFVLLKYIGQLFSTFLNICDIDFLSILFASSSSLELCYYPYTNWVGELTNHKVLQVLTFLEDSLIFLKDQELKYSFSLLY